MKEKMKKVLSLLMIFTLSLSLTSPVQAANSTVRFEDGKIIAFEPGSVYTDSDLFSNFKEVMPGDQKREDITVVNEADDFDYIKVYMRALVHDEEENPLSEGVADTGETVASMRDFLSQLSMTVYNGADKIFDAAPDQLNGLAENTYLGSLKKGERLDLSVELNVPIELDNKYRDRAGEVDWAFVIEGFDVEDNTVTVQKLWNDSGNNRPDSIFVELLENETVFEEIELNAENQWTYTWTNLSEKSDWSVREVDVPENYEVSYDIQEHLIRITNKEKDYDTPDLPEPAEPVDLMVKKEWDGREGVHPESVEVTLYDGKKAVDTVQLGSWNDWSHEWKQLDGNGDWKVLESVIPKGYTPIYRVTEEGLVITNAETLIQTGLLNWPIWLLVIAGISFIFFGYKMRDNDKSTETEIFD